MNKKICIYPKDESTDFLSPLFDALCKNGWKGWHEDTNLKGDEVTSLLNTATSVLFLGHGSSGILYGTPRNGELTNLINIDNIGLLQRKPCFILACNSNQFCENYKLIPSIGFGNMPTGMRDVKSQIEDDPSFPDLSEKDIAIYNNALVRLLKRSFNDYDIDHMELLHQKIFLYTNVEIVECLTTKACPHYREVADLLLDFKSECLMFDEM